MVKILLGIALAVMVATAALGFLAHENAVKLQGVLKDTRQNLKTTTTNLANTKTKLEKTEGELTAANEEIKKKGEEIAMQKGQMDELNKKIADATVAMEAKTAEYAKLKKEYDDYVALHEGKTPAGGGDNPIVTALKADVAKAQTEVAESRALVDSLNKQKKEAEEKVAALEIYKKTRELGIARQGLSGRILAVNSGWNFVVLSIGDKQGAVMNAVMLVVRGGEPIAKVRISSVEPSTSIADIVPGSVRRGVTVQPGDAVVFEGRNPAANAPAPAAAGGLPPLPQP